MPLKKACEEEKNNGGRLASDTSLSSTPLMPPPQGILLFLYSMFYGPFKPTPKQKQKCEGEILSEFQVKRIRGNKISFVFFHLQQK